MSFSDDEFEKKFAQVSIELADIRAEFNKFKLYVKETELKEENRRVKEDYQKVAISQNEKLESENKQLKDSVAIWNAIHAITESLAKSSSKSSSNARSDVNYIYSLSVPALDANGHVPSIARCDREGRTVPGNIPVYSYVPNYGTYSFASPPILDANGCVINIPVAGDVDPTNS